MVVTLSFFKEFSILRASAKLISPSLPYKTKKKSLGTSLTVCIGT